MQQTYTIKNIANIVGGKLIGNVHANELYYLVIDSRKIIFPESSLFFALKGPQHNGHHYIEKAIEKGVTNFIISNIDIVKQNTKNCTFVLVHDTMVALQKLATHHRANFNLPNFTLVGITGSNGKTIVKDWLYHALSNQYNICRNPKSYNSQVGVPLSIWNLQPENEMGIFEAGISEKGEMEKLEKMLQPTIGIFTNIGTAHEDNFANNEEKIREKLGLFKNSSTIILRNDDAIIEDEIKKIFLNKKLITWGSSENAQYKCSYKRNTSNTEIYISYSSQNYLFSIPFINPSSIENAIHVFICSIVLNANMDMVIEQMKWLPQINMRLSFKTGKNNCFIIDDTYSNDVDSLKIAIDSLSNLNQYENKTVILSDIAQSKTKKPALYKEIASILKQKNISKVIGIGNEISNYKEYFGGKTYFFKNAQSLLHQLHEINFQNEAILVKGARFFELERIVNRLENKVHNTILEVNLNAIVHNINYYRKCIPPNTKIMAMVKASGYGTGTHEIANLLSYHHVDYLSVAFVDEGIELRNHGIQLPIMVMNAEYSSFDLLVEKKLEPVIYNFESLFQLIDHQKNGNKIPPIHIEVDTGMHRLGFDAEKMIELIALLKKEKDIEIKSIFSHLAASDEVEMDFFTVEQINSFKNISSKFEKELGIHLFKHIANSAGASRFKMAAFDMIRLGVGLYGIGANAIEQAKLQPVIGLYSTIAQITIVKKGESIGYGRSFIAYKEMVIATIPIGYADGYRRSMGNGNGKMFIDGKQAKVVGRVCMDMTMIDITTINAEVGDRVEIIGENQPIEIFAKAMDTIPYEVLTSISQRVRRIYTQE